MTTVAAWVLAVLGVTLLPLFVGILIDRWRERQPYRPEVVYRPAEVGSVVYLPGGDDDQAIRDHRRLVEQYKDMIDELYAYGEGVVQRSQDQE